MMNLLPRADDYLRDGLQKTRVDKQRGLNTITSARSHTNEYSNQQFTEPLTDLLRGANFMKDQGRQWFADSSGLEIAAARG